MTFSLAPSAIQAGYRFEYFEIIDSTTALAIRRARSGEMGPIWFVSNQQTAGRGRRGRPWSSPHGNLAATLLMRPKVGIGSAATLGFVAGLALASALEAILPAKSVAVGLDGGELRGAGRFELKWPNDVLLDGAKLSGIGLESTILPEGGYALAIGIGVNVLSHPDDLPYAATDLRTLGSRIDAGTLFLALSDAWMGKIALWRDGRGLDEVRKEWLTRAAGLGSEVAIRADGEVVRGIFETIDEECRFLIRMEDGSEKRIAVGDVHFGAVASASSA